MVDSINAYSSSNNLSRCHCNTRSCYNDIPTMAQWGAQFPGKHNNLRKQDIAVNKLMKLQGISGTLNANLPDGTLTAEGRTPSPSTLGGSVSIMVMYKPQTSYESPPTYDSLFSSTPVNAIPEVERTPNSVCVEEQSENVIAEMQIHNSASSVNDVNQRVAERSS